jgi:O-antigen/teichoic acid export membrane protein
MRKVCETLGTRFLLICIGLITSVVIARILGPEGRGLYGVAMAIGAIVIQFMLLGLNTSNTYYVAKNRELLAPLLGNTIVASFVLGSISVLIIGVVFYIQPNWAPIEGLLLVFSLIWIPFGMFYLLLQRLIIGIYEVRIYNKVELINSILIICFVGILIFSANISVEGVFSAGLVSMILSILWILWKLMSKLNKFPRPSFTLFKESIRYGLKAYIAAFFMFIVLKVDLLMVKYILDAEQAGYYSIAAAMADMVSMLPVVVGTVLFPKLSAMDNKYEKWLFAKKVIIGTAFIMAISVSFASLLAEPAVKLLFGLEFIHSVPAFVWLMPGIFMLSINTIFMIYFASIGMPIITIYSPGVAAIVNLALNMKLIPFLGIVGASISSTISYGLMLIITIIVSFYLKKKIVL